MGQQAGDDFEKGEAEGTVTALRLIEAAAKAFHTEQARSMADVERP